jgi:uncharacterized integral membrane protein
MTDPRQPGYPPPGDSYPSGGPASGSSYPAGAPGTGQSAAGDRPPEEQRAAREPKFAFSLGQVLGAILFILLIVFIVENNKSVPIRIIAGPVVHPPLWVAIIIAAVLGALIAALLRYRRRVSTRRRAIVRQHKSEGRQ